jgi:hypothetical protein
MSAPCYIAWNQDTSALTGPPTSTALVASTLKTVLQIKPGASKIRIVEWGYNFDTVPTAAVTAELVETGTVFATVTTLGSGIRPYNDDTGAASLASVGVSASGFNASAEGSVTASRLLAYQNEWNSEFKQQFPLGREPEVNAASALRLRFKCANVINVSCYVVWEE